MRHSFVTLFSILTCIVYGQLPGIWNHNLYGFRPNVAYSPSTLSNSARFSIDAQRDTVKQPEARGLFVHARIARLEQNYRNLAEEFRTNLSNADKKITDLINKLASTTEALDKTAELAISNAKVAELDTNLKDTSTLASDTSTALKTLQQDQAGTTEALKVTTADLATTNTKVADLDTKLKDTSKLASDTSSALDTFKEEQSGVNANTEMQITNLQGQIDAITCTCKADDLTTVNRIPGSCSDLVDIGYTKSGLYSVLNGKQIQTVYCDFTKNPSDYQKAIGYQDIKSKPVYFYVQKTQSYSEVSVPIPYELTIINSGEAMDAASGIFTAPVEGTYFFSFTGLARFASSTDLSAFNVLLYRNSQSVARCQVFEVDGFANDGNLNPLVLQTTLTLQVGDKVWVQSDIIIGGILIDFSDTQCTNFNGWLIEEEIAISL
ncbi:uncharacterized protein LOC130698163 [Daphnia carinata]|uniref:uncharacterized protein LOC130698163 n=1 Tax=Daphnia carinata TaxID=120202 RepID=UPI00257C3346|nr:uncharacterized protein LOC130698163 [Daphnia carinata]